MTYFTANELWLRSKTNALQQWRLMYCIIKDDVIKQSYGRKKECKNVSSRSNTKPTPINPFIFTDYPRHAVEDELNL
jgi:hypothetical protein